MAVVKIWKVKSRLDRVIDYVANIEKTENESYEETDIDLLHDVIEYTTNGLKTEDKYFVSGIHCQPEFACEQMIETKRQHKNTKGILAFHAYQSFAPGEVTPAVAHEIGTEFAKKMCGDRFEVVVSTHVNAHCVHNHFLLNSVSRMDGKKYYDNKKNYAKMREISDDLCRQYGLSVIKNPEQGRTKSYDEYEAEKNGEPTKNSIIKHDIDECIKLAMTEKDFYYRMKKRGYTFNFNRKYVTVSHAKFNKPRRLKTLGDDYTPESISKRIEEAWRNEEVDIPKQEYPAYEMWGRSKPKDYHTVYVQFVTVVSVVKSRPNSNRNLYKLLGDQIRKFDRLIEQQNLLCGNDIDTPEQLTEYKEKCKAEISELTEARSKLRSMLKTAERKGDTIEITELKDDISNLSNRLKKLRRDIFVCDRIKEQEPKIQEKIDKAKESNMKEIVNQKHQKNRS
ncbi:MAG: relaxase/mobilization nuclease domain-containing protein [Ruminococcus flavefaciens]|nr:relaxase/mobilization nuclease domain-containing protein [Ruminococcus flavefaciens]